MYDWANSVYQLTITSTIFPIYYNNLTNPANGSLNQCSGPPKSFRITIEYPCTLAQWRQMM